MPNYDVMLKIMLALGLLISFSAVDAQMNRESPSFAERIPRFDESFLDQPAGAATSSPVSLGLSASTQESRASMDLSATAEPTQIGCNQVSFAVTLTADPLSATASGNQAVTVKVIDQVNGASQTVSELTLLVPAVGGSTSATIGFPAPADASTEPGWSNEIAIVVDPENAISESDENNNLLVVTTICQ
ncbi:MAG: hypothetical protein HPY61_11420 [Methanotrichaceae archaeon]|nr:hypothetical protein [Methanotrichaceae archaeon]